MEADHADKGLGFYVNPWVWKCEAMGVGDENRSS